MQLHAQVQLFADGEMTISRESSDDLREGAFITDILPKIKGVGLHPQQRGRGMNSHMHIHGKCGHWGPT